MHAHLRHVHVYYCNLGVTLNMTIKYIHVCNMNIVRPQKEQIFTAFLVLSV